MIKKILFVLALVFIFIFISCTENSLSRTFGGTMTINLPKGQKLIMATWKKTSLFYLTEPMDSIYVPKTKVFQENSNWGVVESKVLFIESR